MEDIMDLNRAMLIGRLGQDPEAKTTSTGKTVVRMSVKTSERTGSGEDKKDKTEWHAVIAWEKTAEICQKYLKKGSRIFIEGRIQTREWENKEGVKQRTTEIVASNVMFLDPPKSSEGKPTGQPEGKKEGKTDDFPF
jgi:single-strand DNA-binding protein